MPDSTSAVRILIAGGGTGGHVLPAIAVIEELRSRGTTAEFFWIGSTQGVERDIARRAGIPFVAIQTGKLRRYVSARTFTDALRIPVGIAQAWRHVRRFRPNVVYSTGGAVSVPSTIAASRVAPILTHEQTAQIGLANKTVARFASTFAVGYEATAEMARLRHQNVVVTGNPVRASLHGGDADRGLAQFGFVPHVPVVFVTGGARGASPLNSRIESVVARLLEHAQVVHQVGPSTANDDLMRLTAKRETLPAALQQRYVLREFLGDELPDLYAITNLVVARAGAGTVGELSSLGLPSILVPLPGTWGDEQTKNARILGDPGAAVVLAQADATPERLLAEMTLILEDPQRQQQMRATAKNVATPDAAQRLVDELLKLANHHS